MDEEPAPPLDSVDRELRQLLGLFDAPAFARRGQDLEYALDRLHAKLARQRSAMLEMVRLRLRQWAAAASGPAAWSAVFAGPIDELWALAGADAPVWFDKPGNARRFRAVGRDLVASIERFNRRWKSLIHGLDLEVINRTIEQYNNYYMLEKECVLGSARLAARHFMPRASLTRDDLIAMYPPLPVPVLRG